MSDIKGPMVLRKSYYIISYFYLQFENIFNFLQQILIFLFNLLSFVFCNVDIGNVEVNVSGLQNF